MDAGPRSGRASIPPSRRRGNLHRLSDVHIKDVAAQPTAQGRTVEIGRGVIDIPKPRIQLDAGMFKGSAGAEDEKDEKDPLPGSAESIG